MSGYVIPAQAGIQKVTRPVSRLRGNDERLLKNLCRIMRAGRRGVIAAQVFSVLILCIAPGSRADTLPVIKAPGFSLVAAEGLPGCSYALPSSQGNLSACGFRVRVSNPSARSPQKCSLVSYDRFTGRLRDRVDLTVTGARLAAQSEPVQVVDDPLAKLLGQPRLFALAGDRINVAVRTVGGAASSSLEVELAAVSTDGSALATELLDLGVTVLRTEPGGTPAVGADPIGSRRMMWYQLQILDEVMSQCGLRVPPIEDVPFRILDPPRGDLLTIGDPWGLTSKGGLVRLMVEGKPLGPWSIPKGLSPAQTAHVIAAGISEHGYRADVYTHPRIASGNQGPADITVRSRAGDALTITAWPELPISTDGAQPIDIGRVTLCDGLDCYDHRREPIGTVEERSLIELLNRPWKRRSIEVIAVSRFGCRVKLGEAFTDRVGPGLDNTVIIDSRAALRARNAFVLPHEIGHVLLRTSAHPSSPPENAETNLMSWDTSAGLDGPRRLTRRQCDAMRAFHSEGLSKIKKSRGSSKRP